ncbi:MAG: hypothetical protein GF398_21960 [Chitinivibrionales bacterium]|nr:hypothetical protein [Chitinivibrionales bacterium]
MSEYPYRNEEKIYDAMRKYAPRIDKVDMEEFLNDIQEEKISDDEWKKLSDTSKMTLAEVKLCKEMFGTANPSPQEGVKIDTVSYKIIKNKINLEKQEQ